MLHNSLMKVVEMSLVGCYSVVIVLVARGLLWKCERKYSYYLWFIVFLNLSLPFVLESHFSLIPKSLAEFSIEEDLAGLVGNMGWDAGGIKDGWEMQEGDSSPEQAGQHQDLESVGFPAMGDDKEEQTWYTQEIVGLVWILGIAVILGVNTAVYLRLKLRIRKGRILFLDKANRIKVVDSVQTAFVCGMIRPWVYLPTGMAEEEKAYITAHEQYHRKRKDYLLKAAALCITAVHWFNPFAWVALLLFCQDMEVSCDEKVLEHTSGQIRKQYAASLLKYAAMQNGFLVTSLNFGKPALESRIKNVLKEKRKSILITVAAVIGVLAVAMGLFLRPLSEVQDGGNSSLSDDGASSGSVSDEEPALGGTEGSDRVEGPKGTESPDSQMESEVSQQLAQLRADIKAFEIKMDQFLAEMSMLQNNQQ